MRRSPGFLTDGEDAEARDEINGAGEATRPASERYRVVRIESFTAPPAGEDASGWETAERVSSPSLRTRALVALGLVCYALLNLGDLVTTRIGLTMGLREGNPLMSRLLAAFGFDALIFYKVLVVVLVSIGVIYLVRRHQVIAGLTLTMCSLLVGFAVASNLLQFVQFAHVF